MPWCNQCNRRFADRHHFEQHLNGASNADCRLAHHQRRIPGKYNLSRRRQGTKRSHDSDVQKPDYSVFDFTDEADNAYKPINAEPKAKSKADNTDSEDTPPNNGDDEANEEVEGVKQAAALPEPAEVNTTMLRDFKIYAKRAKKDFMAFPPEEAAAIDLMKMMNDKGGSLVMFNEIMEWHVDHLKATEVVRADKLYRKLEERYDMTNTMPYKSRVTLPFCGVTVDIPCHDAAAQIKDLLTDPNIKPSDYLFFNGDPKQGPPDEFKRLRDINTGLAYRETHKKLIGDEPLTANGRIKMLMPIMFYMDGCVMGQFDNLPLEILKICLGIFNGKYRDKDCAWRSVAMVPHFLRDKNRAEEVIRSSEHINAKDYLGVPTVSLVDASEYQDAPDFEKEEYIYSSDEENFDTPEADKGTQKVSIEPKLPQIHAQDFHKILQVMLSSYKKLQDQGGFEWDIFYEGEMIQYLFLPFVINIKGDTVEHDKHCASYNSRTKGVAQLCRYCCCPTNLSDVAYRDDKPKTQKMINDLVKAKDSGALKKLSQHELWNAWYQIRFGAHNKCGVHGACTLEPLHWINLGMFKYGRGNLFEQLGPTSKLGDSINDTATHIGFLLCRQSDKDLPRTRFSKGVKKGKLMGHEMTGMMLVLVAALRSTHGRELIIGHQRGKQKVFFADARYLQDWIMNIESSLQFEEWLKSEELDVSVVRRAKTKVKELMQMNFQVGKRTKGMGMKTMNFHGTKHVPQDILNFGVTRHVNTMSNEKHHKRDKKTSKLTQRRPATFDFQCAKKIQHRHMIDYASEDLNGRPKWLYHEGFYHPEPNLPLAEEGPQLTGARAQFFYRTTLDEPRWVYRVHSSMKNKQRFVYDPMINKMIVDLAIKLNESCGLQELWTHTELRVPVDNKLGKSQVYRASPYHDGKPWLDWAMCNLHVNKGDPAHLKYMPCHIQCFIDLTTLPALDDEDKAREQGKILPGMCALVHTSTFHEEDGQKNWSQLFEPYLKDLANNGTDVSLEHPQVEFIHVNQILEPTAVIPDLDHPSKRAFHRLVPRCEWADQFDDWLRESHERNFDIAQTEPDKEETAEETK